MRVHTAVSPEMAGKKFTCIAVSVVMCALIDIFISRKVIRIYLSNSREQQDINYRRPCLQLATTHRRDAAGSERMVSTLIPRQYPKLYLTEGELLSDGSFLHSKDMADGLFSTVSIIGDRSFFSLGESIKVQIDLLKGNNHRKHIGGDYLRLWMEDQNNGAFVSGNVIDHRNGSYTGVLKALWVGQAIIRVFLAGTREEILLYYKLYELYSSMWTINAGFVAGNISERTQCSTVAFDGDMCNMTSQNGGLPWFCKKPLNIHLACETWRTTSSKVKADFYLDPNEKDIYEMGRNPGPYHLRDSAQIYTIGGGTRLPAPSVPCNRLSAGMTWSRISPAGFFYKAAWQSTLCNDTLPRTPTAYRACLKRKTLWLPGDSTSVQFWKFLQQYLNISYPRDTSEKHGPRIITDKESNFSVIWHAHELPFYHGRPVHNRTVNLAEHVILDNLPNATQDVIVLYLYVHFTLVHPDVFRRHVKKLVQSAKDLLARAPNVTLAVRGPHAFYKSVAVKRGLTSYWGPVYEDILHENFSTLRNKIVYLDFWDMTVAMESYNIHPNTHVIKNMVHNMMSFLCYRNLES